MADAGIRIRTHHQDCREVRWLLKSVSKKQREQPLVQSFLYEHLVNQSCSKRVAKPGEVQSLPVPWFLNSTDRYFDCYGLVGAVHLPPDWSPGSRHKWWNEDTAAVPAKRPHTETFYHRSAWQQDIDTFTTFAIKDTHHLVLEDRGMGGREETWDVLTKNIFDTREGYPATPDLPTHRNYEWYKFYPEHMQFSTRAGIFPQDKLAAAIKKTNTLVDQMRNGCTISSEECWNNPYCRHNPNCDPRLYHTASLPKLALRLLETEPDTESLFCFFQGQHRPSSDAESSEQGIMVDKLCKSLRIHSATFDVCQILESDRCVRNDLEKISNHFKGLAFENPSEPRRSVAERSKGSREEIPLWSTMRSDHQITLQALEVATRLPMPGVYFQPDDACDCVALWMIHGILHDVDSASTFILNSLAQSKKLFPGHGMQDLDFDETCQTFAICVNRLFYRPGLRFNARYLMPLLTNLCRDLHDWIKIMTGEDEDVPFLRGEQWRDLFRQDEQEEEEEEEDALFFRAQMMKRMPSTEESYAECERLLLLRKEQRRALKEDRRRAKEEERIRAMEKDRAMEEERARKENQQKGAFMERLHVMSRVTYFVVHLVIQLWINRLDVRDHLFDFGWTIGSVLKKMSTFRQLKEDMYTPAVQYLASEYHLMHDITRLFDTASENTDLDIDPRKMHGCNPLSLQPHYRGLLFMLDFLFEISETTLKTCDTKGNLDVQYSMMQTATPKYIMPKTSRWRQHSGDTFLHGMKQLSPVIAPGGSTALKEHWNSRKHITFLKSTYFLPYPVRDAVFAHNAYLQMNSRVKFFKRLHRDVLMASSMLSGFLPPDDGLNSDVAGFFKRERDDLRDATLLKVSREDPFFDFQATLANIGRVGLRRPLSITFYSEVTRQVELGADYGGVVREFMAVMSHQFKEDFFQVSEGSEFYWFADAFSNAPFDKCSIPYFYTGVVLGLALYNNVFMDLPLSYPFWNQLLGIQPKLMDFKTIVPDLYVQMQKLYDYDEETLEDLDMVFEVTCNITGRKIDLQRLDSLGEDDIQEPKPVSWRPATVTKENLDEYIVRFLHYHCILRFRQCFVALKSGIHTILSKEELALFTAKELAARFKGTNADVYTRLKDKFTVRNKDPTSPAILLNNWLAREYLWFKEILSDLDDGAMEAFLQFLTGRPNLPANFESYPNFVLVIDVDQKNMIPQSRVCFNVLEMSRYSEKDAMYSHMQLCMDYRFNFGFI